MIRSALLVLLLALALAAPAVAAEPQASLPDIEDEVMCAQCGTALSLSQSQVADDERDFIRDQIALGRTKQEIKDALVDRYGPSVLAMPVESGFNLTAYLVPAVLVAFGIAGVGIAATRWRRARRPDEPAADDGPRLDPSDESRLNAELAAFDR
jgi:cytochrome c-type biogenesis protein CcmH